LVLDAAPLVALADRADPMQGTVAAVLGIEPGDLVIPAPVCAEVDYLLGTRLGRAARMAFLDDLAAGRFAVPCLEPDDYPVVAGLEQKYADLDVGLADLAVVVLAGRMNTRRLLTFDERHFRALRSLKGAHFILLPADDPPTVEKKR
jgi:predicted nucleic acid-binding protein